MKKLFIISLFIAVLFSFNSYSQDKKLESKINQQTILKPTVIVGDVLYIQQLLNNVEIHGNEVESFLGVKTVIANTLQTIQTKNLQANDSLTMEINLLTAQNLLNLLERSTITGAYADKYKRFIESVVESAKSLQK